MVAALIPVLILLITGLGFFILTATRSFRPRGRIVPALAWTGIIGSAIACYRLWGYRLSAFGWVESDRLGQFLSLVILAGLGLAMPALMAQRKLGEWDPIRFAKLVGWLFLSAAGMLLVCSTRNLGVVFISVEILCAGAGVLSGCGSSKSSRSFFSLGNRLGSTLILLGLAAFLVTLKTLDLPAMEAVLVDSSNPIGWISVAGLAFVVAGLMAKLAGLFSQIPSSGQKYVVPLGILASLSMVAFFGVLLRTTGWLLSLAEPATVILGVVSVLGVSIGNGLALRQRRVESVLAFCGFAHIGYLSLGIAAGGVEAWSSVLFYLLIHTLMSVGAFSAISGLETDRGRWRGLTWTHPFSGLTLSLFLLSLAAMVPTAGGIARFYLLAAAVAGDHLFLVAVGLIGSFLGAYCYLKILFTLYRQTPPTKLQVGTSGMVGKLALVLMSSAVIAIGILPEPWLTLVRRVALEFF